MADFLSDIVTGILARATATLPLYTQLDGYLNVSEWAAQQKPFVMAYNPASSGDEIEWRQTQMVVACDVILLRDDGESSELRVDMEALRASIYGSDTLGSRFDTVNVTDLVVDSTREGYEAGRMTVAAVKVL